MRQQRQGAEPETKIEREMKRFLCFTRNPLANCFFTHSLTPNQITPAV
jgi:hypothetical protein